MFGRSRLLLPAMLLLPLAVAPAHSTTMVSQSVEQLATRSTAVVRAMTVATRSSWTASRAIETTAGLRVIESLAGSFGRGQEIEVVVPGGEIDGIQMIAIGAPLFTVAEEVVVFVERVTSDRLGVIDLAQGKFEVRRDAAGVERLTRAGLDGVEFVAAAKPVQPSDLATLRTRVSRALRDHR